MQGIFNSEGAEEQVLFNLFYQGFVLRNDDPEQLGRVKVNIPGLKQETTWALPVGVPGAGPDRGLFILPPVGSNVLVGFVQGDEQMPFYFCGPWGAQTGTSEVPREVRNESPADANQVRVLESEYFEVFINDKQKKLVLRTKTKDEEIEIDAEDRSISIKATNWVKIEAGGVSINGRKVQVANRVVAHTGTPV